MTTAEPNVIQNIDEMDDPTQSMDMRAASRGRGGIVALLRGNIVLAVMTAASLGAVGLLALRAKPQAASAEETQAGTQLEATIAMLDMPAHVRDGKADTMKEAFYCESARRQIPMEKLLGNPFVFVSPEPPPETTTKPDKSSSRSAKRQSLSRNEEFSRAMREVRKLELESVLLGPQGPVAMISGNLLAKGQIISGWTISEIRPLEVVLTWRNRKHALKISE